MTNTSKNIGRKRKKNGFTQVSNQLIEDSRLSWKAKGILIYLLSRPNNWKVNKSDLERRATEGKASLDSGIEELKEMGYLHIYRNRLENGQIDGWVWEYDDEPFTPEIHKNRNTDNPPHSNVFHMETRTTVNPYYGKSELRETGVYNNTHLNNKDFNNTNNKEIKKISANRPKKATDEELQIEFEKIWKLYPNKKGKTDALKSYKSARRKNTSYETIEKGLYKYKDYLEKTGTEYILHGSTWFNQHRWEDEYIITGLNKKPKNATEYLKMKYGGSNNESNRNGEIIDHHTTVLPEFF